MNTEKILVEVTLPATQKQFDVFIPLESQLAEVVQLLEAALSQLSDDTFIGQNSVLCEKESGIIYNMNMRIADLHLKNGASLMLI